MCFYQSSLFLLKMFMFQPIHSGFQWETEFGRFKPEVQGVWAAWNFRANLLPYSWMLEKKSKSREYIYMTLTETMQILIYSTKSSFVGDLRNVQEKCDIDAKCYLLEEQETISEKFWMLIYSLLSRGIEISFN